MRLSLKDSGEVVLTLPKYVPEFMGKFFVQQNIEWIKENQKKVRARKLPIINYKEKNIENEFELTFYDQKFYTIKILKTTKKKSFYEENFKKLILYMSQGSTSERQVVIRNLIQTFYKEKAKQHLTERSKYFAEKLNVNFNRITIKNTKSRWGSCSTKKNLNYNWRIMMAPREVIDYLVVHEVCHLKQMNHSTKFWSLVENLDPDFKIHKKYLRDKQSEYFNFIQ